jgi:hypothetical protein
MGKRKKRRNGAFSRKTGGFYETIFPMGGGGYALYGAIAPVAEETTLYLGEGAEKLIMRNEQWGRRI